MIRTQFDHLCYYIFCSRARCGDWAPYQPPESAWGGRAQMSQFRMFDNMFGCFTHRFKVRRSDGSTSKIRTVEKHLDVLNSDSRLTGGRSDVDKLCISVPVVNLWCTKMDKYDVFLYLS